ncbi:MAG: rhodanese-like domain-containing protein [Planctomycetaceae bacterium]|nr:rhodanese-like domain-containing protein [Planctomycetaceae bacterium]
MQTISRRQAQNLIDTQEDLAVLEILDAAQYQRFHLPRARNVPLDDAFARNVTKAAPHKDAPVLVYCLDAECDASTRAAQQLEDLGYTDVYDYEAGKVDWKEAGLPVEGPSGSAA